MKPKNEQLQTEQQLKTLKTLKADKEFIAAFRQILAARIAHETPIRHSVFIPWLTRFAAAAACFIMITGAAGLSISYANQTSNPDSFWYKIKIATENLQLTLVENNPLESAALSAKFAQHRL